VLLFSDPPKSVSELVTYVPSDTCHLKPFSNEIAPNHTFI
jgi:hypothetical protein